MQSSSSSTSFSSLGPPTHRLSSPCLQFTCHPIQNSTSANRHRINPHPGETLRSTLHSCDGLQLRTTMYTTVMPTTPPTVRFGPRDPVGNGQQWPGQQHRPLISSPLSSPPHSTATIPTTFDSSPPARWQQNQKQQNQVFRASQSSPIQPPPTPSLFSGSEPHNSTSKFRFATRPARPNPLLKRREDAQESRRRLFLQNVRQRAEDKRWEMRGGEEEVHYYLPFLKDLQCQTRKRSNADWYNSSSN